MMLGYQEYELEAMQAHDEHVRMKLEYLQSVGSDDSPPTLKLLNVYRGCINDYALNRFSDDEDRVIEYNYDGVDYIIEWVGDA